jgi:hypothetical protein
MSGYSHGHRFRQTPTVELAILFQRESEDDSARARTLADQGDLAGAKRNQKFAATTAAQARHLLGN